MGTDTAALLPLCCSYEREMDEDISPRAFAVLVEAQVCGLGCEAGCEAAGCQWPQERRSALLMWQVGNASEWAGVLLHFILILACRSCSWPQEEEMRRSLSDEMRRSRSLSPDRGHTVY